MWLGIPKMKNKILSLLISVSCLWLVSCASTDQSNVSIQSAAADSKGNSVSQPLSSDAFSDIPVVNGDTIDLENSLVINPGHNWIGQVALKSKLSSESAFGYYSEAMSRHGWTMLTSIQSIDSAIMFEKGARLATVNIRSNGKRGSFPNITVSLRKVPSF